MTKLTLANNGGSVTEKNIDSQSLLMMVNEARKQCGEPPVRNNKFIEKVEDELEGETYTKSVGRKNGQEIDIIHMTIKQSLRVAARESKAVRRSLVDKLEAMNEAHLKAGKSATGLVEYRKARTLKLTVEAVTNLFDLMPHLAPEAKQVAAASLINPVAGFDAIPLPAMEESHYTAGEVGKMLDVSANKIGRIANKHNLKTEEFGKFFLDKSAHSAKQVEAFRYNANGVEALRHLIHGADVA
ncbi:TPA: hypothetical protein ACGD7V_000910 [Serratia marcescens]|uniref:hypothetical protein n=1 Tax=Serratia marcescens TaxID=615 RepID=UPI0007453E95|nr:hypothetical protein [Serratia marcescens]BEN67456.1 hypothetical protein SMKC073_06300 [Serratia marcescens]BEN81806.1 hypothetical protein SMKC103_06300 [Serratia marcescens]CVF84648.1 Uncharacterised protein [Serratia marcescens]HEP0388804.1 hypothetical protein [Serratia marcescens]